MARRGFWIGIFAVAALLLPAAGAGAATIAPNTFSDEFSTGATCSLREAIEAARLNAAFGGCPAGAPGQDDVPLASGTYTLTIPQDGSNEDNADGDLDVFTAGTDIALTRVGVAPVTISGGGVDRIFHVFSGARLRATGLTFRGGLSAGAGGAINNAGGLDLTDSTFTDNQAALYGGAIANGGVGAVASLFNVTISGNRALTDSGGVDNSNSGSAGFAFVTITDNIADFDGNDTGHGGGFTQLSGNNFFRNSILAGNIDRSGQGPDCNGPVTSVGNNIIQVTAAPCVFTPAAGDKPGVAPLLGALAGNGGPTFTHALVRTSPAVDAGVPVGSPLDQRGVPRAKPDIGAYELVLCGGLAANIVGTGENDVLAGTPGRDSMLGLEGNDTLSGLAGKDALCGGNGKDRLRGGGGKDKLFGQGGRDRLIGGKGKDVCKGGGGRKDKLKGC